MPYYAKINNDRVVEIQSGELDFLQTNYPGTEWIQVSYNTRGNVHYLPNSNTPSGQPPVKGNYPGPGYIYDRKNDVFYSPCPHAGWILNTTTWLWEPPTKCPAKPGFRYYWDDNTQDWGEYPETS